LAKLPILLTPELEGLLTVAERAQFLADFKYWKGTPNNGKQTTVFGRNVLNHNSKYLTHVHMVPLAPVAQPVVPPVAPATPPAPPPPPSPLQQWQTVYNNNQKHNANQDQTSNRYLFYTYDKRHGFLLIMMINDNAHDIWNPKYQSVLQNWEEIAEDFVCFGTVPDA